jgi:putative DNA primase/helicase
LLDWLISVATDSAEEEAALRHWLISWYAWPIQHPGAKLRTALIFHGDEGAGKNLLNDCVCDIYGRYAAVVGQDELEDKFNDWRSSKQFVVGDEVVSAQELGHTKNRLKNLITSPTVQINPKGLPRRQEANMMNIVFLSNEVRPLKLDNTDRRYLVVWTPPARERSFYEEIGAWRDRGGVGALHRFLLDYDTSSFDPFSAPPKTRAKLKLIDLSRSASEQFLLEWSEGDTDFPFCSGTKQQVFDGYRKWCQQTGQRFVQDMKTFARQLERLAESNSIAVREWRGAVGTGVAPKTMRCWQVGTKEERFTSEREWMHWCVDQWRAVLHRGSASIGGSDDAPM